MIAKNMEIHLQAVKDELKDIYLHYRDRGVLAIYLWGSILSPDYELGSSDIDAVAIVHDDIPMQIEHLIQTSLYGKIPGVNKFGFRFLYMSELNGGEIKGNLASYIDVKLLLLDFHNWMRVAGNHFKTEDFALPQLSNDDAIALHVAKARKQGWINTASISERDVMYFLKNLSQTVYMQERKKGMTEPFSYSALEAYASGEEKEIILAINENRRLAWDFENFASKREMYQRYLDDIISK